MSEVSKDPEVPLSSTPEVATESTERQEVNWQQLSTRLLTALVGNEGAVATLREIDEVCAKESAGYDVMVTALKGALAEHPQLLENMNFVASLTVGPQSPLYQKLLQGLADGCGGWEKLPPKLCVRYAEYRRRSGDRKGTDAVAAHLEQELRDDSPEAFDLLAKARYESGMAAFNEKDYEGAISATGRSVKYAERAHDWPGALQGRDNIGGLFLKAQGKIGDGINACTEVLDAVAQYREQDSRPENKQRYDRIEMNTLFHLLDLCTEAGFKGLVRRYLPELEKNPLYQESKEAAWAKGPVEAAKKFLREDEA